MFALLPLVGGLLLGLLAPRKPAVLLQVLLYGIALAMLVLSAPDHGGSYTDVVWLAPALAVVSAGTLWLGFRLARRSSVRGDVDA